MSLINQQASQLLIRIKKSEKPNKAPNPKNPVGWAFLKKQVFLNPYLTTLQLSTSQLAAAGCHCVLLRNLIHRSLCQIKHISHKVV